MKLASGTPNIQNDLGFTIIEMMITNIQLIDKNTGKANYVIIDSLGQVSVSETPS